MNSVDIRLSTLLKIDPRQDLRFVANGDAKDTATGTRCCVLPQMMFERRRIEVGTVHMSVVHIDMCIS